MGHHYVPQQYLRGFAKPAPDAASRKPTSIWMYDKTNGTAKEVAISRVAQQPGFYPDDVEVQLNEMVEKPANEAIGKITNGEALAASDRVRLAYYIATMLRRVPRGRTQAEALVPATITESAENMRAMIRAATLRGDLDPAAEATHLDEVNQIEARFLRDTPDNLRQIIVTPWPTAALLDTIMRLAWRLVVSPGPSWFLTSDNPAVYFTAMGLGDQHSEMVFPICSRIALHGCFQSRAQDTPFRVSEKIVKELNRRIIYGATRFVFYHEQAAWVEQAIRNGGQWQHRINWVPSR